MERQVIIGLSFTFKNLITGKINEKEHKGSDNFIEVQEFEIKDEEYLSDFNIRFPNDAEYITQLGFSTSEKRNFIVGTEEGVLRKAFCKDEDRIIVGAFGSINKRLDSMGVLFVSKKDYDSRKISSL